MAGPVSEFVGGAPSRVRTVVGMALRMLELSAFPRRFSRMSEERRAAHLERLEGSRIGAFRDLFLLLKTLAGVGYTRDARVQAALGVTAGCAREGGQPYDAPRLDPEAMRAPADVERCDVVIVGSGAGGASAARVLSEAGLSVIVVEEGGYHDASTYSTDPFEALPLLYRDSGLTVCEGRPVIPMPVGRCVGGTTVINSGTCFPAPDDILYAWREQHGIPWATELDGEFEAVDRALDVTPLPAGRVGRNAELCRLGAEAIGASNGPIARNAGDVVCCGTCPTGCAIDAKRAMHVSELPRAVMVGCRIRANARVRSVIVENGRAVGVSCSTTGGRYEVRAKAVVLAAGALGTPELLLSQGLAGSSGALGRHLRIHPACWVGGLFEEPVRGWDGVMQSWAVDEWNDRGLFLEATFTPLSFGAHWLRGAGAAYMRRLEDFGRVAVIGVHLSDRSQGRVERERPHPLPLDRRRRGRAAVRHHARRGRAVCGRGARGLSAGGSRCGAQRGRAGHEDRARAVPARRAAARGVPPHGERADGARAQIVGGGALRSGARRSRALCGGRQPLPHLASREPDGHDHGLLAADRGGAGERAGLGRVGLRRLPGAAVALRRHASEAPKPSTPSAMKASHGPDLSVVTWSSPGCCTTR